MNRNRRDKKKKNKIAKIPKKTTPHASDVMRRFREQARQIYEEAKKSGKIGTVLEEARRLALEAKKTDPNIAKIYWFPDDEEVHLIMIDKNAVSSGAERVEPFYFDSTTTDPMPAGIAIIGPDEYRKLILPPGWVDWDNGKEIESETGADS
jgi:hypothetical protein